MLQETHSLLPLMVSVLSDAIGGVNTFSFFKPLVSFIRPGFLKVAGGVGSFETAAAGGFVSFLVLLDKPAVGVGSSDAIQKRHSRNVIEGLTNLFTKLPRLSILDMSEIGEVELQSTYFDVFLSEIIADQDQQVALRWANKSVSRDTTDIRPDAIISTLVQHQFGCPLGFDETKVGPSATKQAVNFDIFRLGITCQRTIERHNLPACLSFMINGYSISFFVVSKRQDDFFTMVEIASLNFASSLSSLHTFATRKNLELLAGVSSCFWSTCARDLSFASPIVTDHDRIDDIVFLSDYMSLMAKSSKGTLGQSFRF